MFISLIIILIIITVVYIVMNQPQFGALPSGKRLERIKASPNYRDGQFQNLSPTPQLTGDISYFKLIQKFFFGKSKRSAPSAPLPSKKINLFSIHNPSYPKYPSSDNPTHPNHPKYPSSDNPVHPNHPKYPSSDDFLIWFGHSSYFLHLSGKNILIDPVFSGHASPFSFTTRAFPGTDVYGVDDMPPLDYLILTHDHYDHLDYKTVSALQPKVAKVVTALGVGAHLEKWVYDPAIITELDWNESAALEPGWQMDALPARHFSGRTFKRNQTLWASFVLSTPARKIYIGGDSGYDTHFAGIGEQYGPFDLAILECGQYNPYWKYIHMSPEEVVQAAIDLKAKRLLPVHWGKFALALHSWDEPIIRLSSTLSQDFGIRTFNNLSRNCGIYHSIFNITAPLAHPLIGEPLYFDNIAGSEEWWKGLK
jgi:L-ascorbate metabolism protein UlaG (beta-lactamase superfamily)